MSIRSMEKRVDALERPMGVQKPAEEAALEILTDNEVGLVAEFVALLKSGHTLEQISSMMEQESYQVACDAITRADAEYHRLTMPHARPFLESR